MTTSSPPASAVPPSALARPFDFSLPSNRYAAAGFALGTLAARLYGHSWSSALGVGAAGLLGWSTARELDPDLPDTAGAALPLAALAALVGKPPHPLAGLSVVSGLRTLAATVGLRPTGLDVAALGGQAALTALSGGRAAALVPGAALALSSTRADGWGVTGWEAAVVGAAALAPGLQPGRGRDRASDLLTLAALALSARLIAPEGVTSPTDRGDATISAERVRLTRLLALGTLGAGLVARDTRSLAPLASAVLAVGTRRVLGRRD